MLLYFTVFASAAASCQSYTVQISGQLHFGKDSDLKCSYSCNTGYTCSFTQVLWAKDQSNVYAHEILTGNTHTYPLWENKVSGSIGANTHNLTVKDVIWDYEGEWACRVYSVECTAGLNTNYLSTIHSEFSIS